MCASETVTKAPRSCPALDAVYGAGTEEKVRTARVLVIGAGGVGCELVKNLAAVGFGKITMIDLDTIDLSNLNRQFLFRRQHVGKPKATEASSSIKSMIPDVNVEGLMANIKEPRFSVQFFKTFTLVCNALDNLEARRHVNRMCLAAGIPLIDSGSTGYSGQCDVIGPGFECYDCISRPTPKSYAVCTIRSTPEKPVHCIVWAKHLFELVFGPPDADNLLADLDGDVDDSSEPTASLVDAEVPNTDNATEATEAPEAPKSPKTDNNADETVTEHVETNGHNSTVPSEVETANQEGENATTQIEQNGTMRAIPKRVRYLETDTPDIFAKRVCERVFIDDIEQQRRMATLWKTRAPPTVCVVEEMAEKTPVKLNEVNALSQTPWSVETSASVLYAVLKHVVTARSGQIGSLSFDKDDADALLLVTAASNLRAHAYGVELQSPFAVKGIAGNIVHAIATTNAMVGGLIVLEALKITANNGDVSKCMKTFVGLIPMGSRVPKLLQTDPMRPPNKKCFVCSQGQLQLSVDVDEMLLKTLVSSVLQKRMSVLQPSVYITTGDYNNTLYECGSGLDDDEIADYEKNLQTRLRQLRVEHGSQLVIEDFAQNLTCRLHVRNVESLLLEAPMEERFTLDGDVPQDDGKTNGVKEGGEDGPVDIEEDEIPEVPVSANKPDWAKLEAETSARRTVEVNGRKRSLETTGEKNIMEEPQSKKAKLDSSSPST